MMATAGVVPFFDTETLQQHQQERERDHADDQHDDDNDDSIPIAIISVKHNKKGSFFVAARNDAFDDANQPPAAEEDEEEAQESTYQALFAEQTALEMQEIVQYWARYIDRDDHHHDRSHYDGYVHHQYADQSICLIGNALANYYNDDHDYDDDVDDEEEDEDIGLLAKDTATSTASSSYTAVASVAFARYLGRGGVMATAAVKKEGSSASLSSSSSSLLGMGSRYEVVHNDDPPLLNTKHDESAAASIRILPRWRIRQRPLVLVLPEQQQPQQQSGGGTRTIFRRLRFRFYCFFDYCHTRAVLSIWEQRRRRHQPQRRRNNNNNNHFGVVVGEVPLYWLQWYLFCHLHSTPILWQVCTTMLLLTTLLALVTVALTVHVQIWRIHVWLVDHIIRSVILMWNDDDDDPWTTAVCWEKTSL
jgi:hypothetical protein